MCYLMCGRKIERRGKVKTKKWSREAIWLVTAPVLLCDQSVKCNMCMCVICNVDAAVLALL